MIMVKPLLSAIENYPTVTHLEKIISVKLLTNSEKLLRNLENIHMIFRIKRFSEFGK